MIVGFSLLTLFINAEAQPSVNWFTHSIGSVLKGFRIPENNVVTLFIDSIFIDNENVTCTQWLPATNRLLR